MNWFTPKLEPGEAVVIVSPPVWPVIPMGLFILGMVFTSALMVVEAGGGHDTVFRIALGLMAGLAASMIALMAFAARWRIAVTTRRVLVRNDFLRREEAEIPRGDIESVTHRDFTLEISGGGRGIATRLHPLFADRIVALLDAGGAARGRYAEPFARLLDPGERLLFKSGGKLLLAMSIFTTSLSVVATGLFLAVADSVLAVVSALQIGTLYFALWTLSSFALAVSDKRWLVTDRRVLTVTGLLYRRVEDLPLGPDMEIALDKTALTIRSGEQTLTLPLANDPDKREAAIRILDAIEAAKGAMT